MRFEVMMASRHLRAGGGQTLLIVAGVAMAVTLVIFINGLIMGLQRMIGDVLTGVIPHITLTLPEPASKSPLTVVTGGKKVRVLSQARRRSLRSAKILNWHTLEKELLRLPHVTAVSPGVSGQALLSHLGVEASVRVLGAQPHRQNRITDLAKDITAGTWLNLGPRDIVMGEELAKDVGATLGDRVRLSTGQGRTEVFRVGGLYQTGIAVIDRSNVYLTLSGAQSMFQTGTAVTSLLVKLDDLFLANETATRLENSFGLKAESWMRLDPDLMDGLRAQWMTSILISTFSLLAAGFAISSVLVVSVLKRNKEIGILKSMGARGSQILRIFTLEALGIAAVGSVWGVLMGALLIAATRQATLTSKVPGRAPEPFLPGTVEPVMVAITVLSVVVVTVIGSILPARQAARLDPVKVIRGG